MSPWPIVERGGSAEVEKYDLAERPFVECLPIFLIQFLAFSGWLDKRIHHPSSIEEKNVRFRPERAILVNAYRPIALITRVKCTVLESSSRRCSYELSTKKW